ncbi:MAG: hypothetical protein Q8Q23_06135 [bacterium]|nr:hypothetical protein [bacterium]
MSKKAIEYLKLNKNKYSETALVEALKKAGYSSHDILDSINEVFGKSSESDGRRTDFWNFRDKKKYLNGLEKTADFFFGLGVPTAIYVFFLFFFFFIFILQIVGIIYFWKRRRHIAIGILVSIVTGPVVALFGMLFFY